MTLSVLRKGLNHLWVSFCGNGIDCVICYKYDEDNNYWSWADGDNEPFIDEVSQKEWENNADILLNEMYKTGEEFVLGWG